MTPRFGSSRSARSARLERRDVIPDLLPLLTPAGDARRSRQRNRPVASAASPSTAFLPDNTSSIAFDALIIAGPSELASPKPIALEAWRVRSAGSPTPGSIR